MAVGYSLLRRTGQCPGRYCPHGAAPCWGEEREGGIDSVCTGVGVCTWVWVCAEAQAEPGWGPKMLKMKTQREH